MPTSSPLEFAVEPGAQVSIYNVANNIAGSTALLVTNNHGSGRSFSLTFIAGLGTGGQQINLTDGSNNVKWSGEPVCGNAVAFAYPSVDLHRITLNGIKVSNTSGTAIIAVGTIYSDTMGNW